MYCLKKILLCLTVTTSAVHAEDCNLASSTNSLVDLRDGGIGFNDGTNAFLSQLRGERCKTEIRATNLPAPRSKILQDFVEPITLRSFTQTINISNISLHGSGDLKFMSLDFISLNSEISRLELFVAPGTVPKGVNQASNYFLSGIWTHFDVSGVEISRNYFLTPAIAASKEISLKWQTTNLGIYGEGMKLDLDLVNSVVPISVYPPPGVQAGMPWGQQKFFPTGKTMGSLSQTSLVPQSSFLLDSNSKCTRWTGTANDSCD